MTKTLKQITPNAPIATFNDAPMRVNGVRVVPTWQWSDDYRKLVRREMAKVSKCPRKMAQQYKRWKRIHDEAKAKEGAS